MEQLAKREEVVVSLCDMPAVFRDRGDVSMVELIVESGYAAAPAEVTQDLIESHLRAHPDLVLRWLHYSEDQRCSPAQYLCLPDGIATKPGSCIVGYIETNRSESKRKRFQNSYRACAFFIKREAEKLRAIANEAS